MEATVENKAGFRKTKNGWIPEDWKLIELGSLTKIYDGTHATPKYVEKGVPFYSVEHVSKDNFQDTKFISEEVFKKENERVKLEKGDVLMTRIGDVGTAKLISWDVRASFYVSLALIKKCSDLHPEYLEQCINGPLFQKELYKRMIHVAFPTKINLGEIGKCLICVPSLDEQVKIAQILSTWDQARVHTQRLISQLKERKRGLTFELLSGRKRLEGFTEKWNNVQIGSIAEQYSTKNKENKEITVLSCTKYDGLVPSLEYFGRKVYGDDISKYKLVPRGYFAYATNHIEEGSIGLQTSLDVGLVSPMYTVFKTSDEIDDSFFFRLLKTDRMIYKYQSNMSGSIARRGGLRWNDFKGIEVSIPSKDEQIAIAKIFDQVDIEIRTAENYLESILKQKKGLMQQLLTGQKRVKI